MILTLSRQIFWPFGWSNEDWLSPLWSYIRMVLASCCFLLIFAMNFCRKMSQESYIHFMLIKINDGKITIWIFWMISETSKWTKFCRFFKHLVTELLELLNSLGNCNTILFKWILIFSGWHCNLLLSWLPFH